MKRIIRLKNFTNSGEKLDDLFVCTDGEGRFVLNNDRSVLFGGNKGSFIDKDEFDFPETVYSTPLGAFCNEIFYYQGKYGYLDDCMNWVHEPKDNITDCEYYEVDEVE